MNSECSPEEIEAKVIQAEADYLDDKVEAQQAQADKERAQASLRQMKLNSVSGDLPDEPVALWSFAEHLLTQSALSMIGAGRVFIKLKEILPHGEYEQGLRDRDISPASAWRISLTAERFADRSDKFLKLGRTKLYGCLDFTNAELDELEEGGSVLDMDLDAIDRMTTRDFRAAMKKKDADIERLEKEKEDIEKFSAKKNVQMDEIAKENMKLHACAVPWDEVVGKIKNEMGIVSNALDQGFSDLLLVHQVILDVDFANADDRDIARRSLVMRHKEVVDRAAIMVAELQHKYEVELCGYMGTLEEYHMQAPDEDDQAIDARAVQ